jgi:hypothetical protein
VNAFSDRFAIPKIALLNTIDALLDRISGSLITKPIQPLVIREVAVYSPIDFYLPWVRLHVIPTDL